MSTDSPELALCLAQLAKLNSINREKTLNAHLRRIRAPCIYLRAAWAKTI